MLKTGPLLIAIGLLMSVGTDSGFTHADWPAQSNRVVSYDIDARLLPADQRVDATMRVVWRNTISAPVEDLYFHLYLNAFKDRDSTFMKESAGRGRRGSEWDEKYPGSVAIRSMKTTDGNDLWVDGTREFEAPDDHNELDRTLARVRLPAPVAPGESVELSISFESRLPRVFRRTGFAGDVSRPESLFFMVAQWYPKIAVLSERDGKPHWNRHQFHANTEFFADYGTFDVKLTVPKNLVVGATGPRVDTKQNDDGTVTYRHQQNDVHDFAWCASPDFVVRKFHWEFDTFIRDADKADVRHRGEETMGQKLLRLLRDTAANLDMTPEELKPKNAVEVTVLLQPDHVDIWERFKWSAGAALACYSLWAGPYPYDVLTIVDPPAGGPAAGGMEYPTLITVWGNRFAPKHANGMEGVTIHEFGHQYFYGLLGSNEFEEAWLDEGFTSFTDARCFEAAYGPTTETVRYGEFTFPRLRPFEPPRVFDRIRAMLKFDKWIDHIPTPWEHVKTWMPSTGGNFAYDYVRDLPALHMPPDVAVPQPQGERGWVAEVGSHDSMVMPGWHYAHRSDYAVNVYGKPTVFLYALRGLMGPAAFDKAFYEYAKTYRFGHPRTEDFVAILEQHAPEEQREVVRGFVAGMLDTGTPFDAAILEADDKPKNGRREWVVKVQRRGNLPLPIEIWAGCEDGHRIKIATWVAKPGETTRTFRMTHDRPLRSVRLGPSWLRDVDRDITNNARFVNGHRDARGALVTAVRLALQAEDYVRTGVGVSR